MISPSFDFSSDSVLLYEGTSIVKRNRTKYEGTAEIKLCFKPKANIVIHTKFSDPRLSRIIDDENIDFSVNQHKIDALVISSQLQLSPVLSKINLVSKFEPIQLILNRRKKAKKIIFHIFNFFSFMGADSFVQLYNGTMYRLDYFTLVWKEYKVKIQSIPSTRDNVKYLKENGGYQMTQVGSIEKSTTLISKEEYNDLQSAIRYFLSFSKGSWINPVCSSGIANTGEKIWHLFNSPDQEWKSLNSWLDPHHIRNLIDLFPLFMDLWDDERWKDTLKEVIYWFLNANNGVRGIDAGLILVQTAIERLSYEYIVYDKKLLSAKGFKDLWASDKFRLLFSSLGLPLNIPSNLSVLSQKARAFNWLDAPHALTEIRNSLVHPEHKKHGKYETEIFIEAHNLSLWYLELSILAICKYKGTYSNRLVNGKYVGTVENVPWI